jgi:methionine-rich copper-binding protein CopC
VKVRALLQVVFLALAAEPPLADAHAVLVRSSPPHRAVLRQAPSQVELWFNERLEPAYSSVTISSRTGVAIKTGAAQMGAQDGRRLSVQLPRVPPAEYLVRFRVLSVDGHVAEGAFAFTVSAP